VACLKDWLFAAKNPALEKSYLFFGHENREIRKQFVIRKYTTKLTVLAIMIALLVASASTGSGRHIS